MTSPTSSDGRNCPAREEANHRIRDLMTQPACRARSEEWQRLLAEWIDACPNCLGCNRDHGQRPDTAAPRR